MEPTSSKLLQHRSPLRSAQQGFTLIELLIATFVTGVILASAIGMINNQRRDFLGDRDRININDNLRVASTLIGDDIKQAGERLEQQSELPVVSVVDGATATTPDSILVQRKLVSEALTICQDVSGGQTTIEVASAGSDLLGCTSSSPTSTIDQIANLYQWSQFRCQQDGTTGCVASPPATCVQTGGTNRECVWAYIYDPTKANPTQRGEFFLISGESKGSCSSDGSKTCWRLTRADGKPWQYSYTQNNDRSIQPRLYVLEQKEYQLLLDTNTVRNDDYTLNLRVNNQTDVSGNPKWQRVTALLANMQIQVHTSSHTNPPVTAVVDQFNPNRTYVSNWQTITGINLTLTGLNPSTGNTQRSHLSADQLTLTSQFFPRNAASTRTSP
jgi:prepilin-type N-terminal cleavage/methylation domain-containing protein